MIAIPNYTFSSIGRLALQKLEPTAEQKEFAFIIYRVALQALYGFAITFLAMTLLPVVIQPVFVPLISIGAFTQAAFFFIQ